MADAPVKISANLSPDVFNALKEIAAKRGVTMTEALRQSISTEKFLQDTIAKNGKILIEDSDKTQRQVILR
jgi:predicted transcriptional regulator